MEREEDQRHGTGEVEQEGGGFYLTLTSSNKEEAQFSARQLSSLPKHPCLGCMAAGRGVSEACVCFARFK